MAVRRLKAVVGHYHRSQSGGAAVEFAIWAAMLAPVLANVIDLGLYAYDKVQVANAGQSAAQAAWSIATTSPCTTANSGLSTSSSNPPTMSCAGLDAAVNDAISQSSVLGSGGTLISRPYNSKTSSYTQEQWGYYCPTTTGVLAVDGGSGGVASCPATYKTGGVTTTFADAGATAGFYYKIEVTFTYHPLFGAASVTNLLGTTMTHDTWIRLQ